MPDPWWEDSEVVREVTEIVRRADEEFEREGGSSRHWVRDCFLPRLAEAETLEVRLPPPPDPASMPGWPDAPPPHPDDNLF